MAVGDLRTDTHTHTQAYRRGLETSECATMFGNMWETLKQSTKKVDLITMYKAHRISPNENRWNIHTLIWSIIPEMFTSKIVMDFLFSSFCAVVAHNIAKKFLWWASTYSPCYIQVKMPYLNGLLPKMSMHMLKVLESSRERLQQL